MGKASTVQSVIETLRFAADEHNWTVCEQQMMVLFDNVDKYKALSVVLQQVQHYHQLIFTQFHDDIPWISDVLYLIEARVPPEQIKLLMRWEEFEKLDQSAYFSSIETLCWTYIALWEENYVEAKAYFLRSLQAIMNAHRYNFWSTLYPHLEQFWDLEDGNLDGMLSSLSYARDPIVQTFMKERWYGVVDQIQS